MLRVGFVGYQLSVPSREERTTRKLSTIRELELLEM